MSVTHEEIVKVVGGLADPATERRVLAAALTEESVRSKLELLRAAEVAPKVLVSAEALKQAMLDAALALAGQKQKHP